MYEFAESLFDSSEIKQKVQEKRKDSENIKGDESFFGSFFDEAEKAVDGILGSMFGEKDTEMMMSKNNINLKENYANNLMTKNIDDIDSVENHVIDKATIDYDDMKTSMNEINTILNGNMEKRMPKFWEAVQEERYSDAAMELQYTNIGSNVENIFYKNNKNISDKLIGKLQEKYNQQDIYNINNFEKRVDLGGKKNTFLETRYTMLAKTAVNKILPEAIDKDNFTNEDFSEGALLQLHKFASTKLGNAKVGSELKVTPDNYGKFFGYNNVGYRKGIEKSTKPDIDGIRHTLGTFTIVKGKDGYSIKDAYDFTRGDYKKRVLNKEYFYALGHFIGEMVSPEPTKEEKSKGVNQYDPSDSNNIRIDIKLPLSIVKNTKKTNKA